MKCCKSYKRIHVVQFSSIQAAACRAVEKGLVFIFMLHARILRSLPTCFAFVHRITKIFLVFQGSWLRMTNQ